MNKPIYRPPPLLGNGHVQTIFPVLFRTVHDVAYTRERISTWDNDFLDLDWSCQGSDRLAVISHGLEGNTSRKYVKGMVRAMNPWPAGMPWPGITGGAAENPTVSCVPTTTGPQTIWTG